jgi:hypothetical protein
MKEASVREDWDMLFLAADLGVAAPKLKAAIRDFNLQS